MFLTFLLVLTACTTVSLVGDPQTNRCDAVDAGRSPSAIRTCDRLFESVGPKIKIILPAASGKLKAQLLNTIRVGHWNVQDLKLQERPPLQALSYSRKPDERPIKPAWAVDSIVRQIEREKLDVLFLSEVIGKESLEELATKLKDEFEPILIEGNDISEIDMGILIRRTLPLEIEVQSHRALTHLYKDSIVPLHSRDLILLTLRKPGESRALISFAGSHLKAPNRGQPGTLMTSIKGTAQLVSGIEILEREKAVNNPRATVFLADFNADIRFKYGFGEFKDAGYREALDLMGIPLDKRITHSRSMQLDGIFVSREIVNRDAILAAYVARGKDGASDHDLEIMELDLTKLR